MQTSNEWWQKTKSDPAALNDWLVKQYRGESRAASRILRFADKYGNGEHRKTLDTIASQESRHAVWVLGLLDTRQVTPSVDMNEERYWKETLPEIESFETGAAVGAHAEKMRLDRIRAIVEDPETPSDIRDVFARILPEEEFHERAFRTMAGPDAMNKTEASHERGMQLLGLVH